MQPSRPDRREFLAALGAAGVGAVAGCGALGPAPCPFESRAATTDWPLPTRDPRNTAAAPADAAPDPGSLSLDWTATFDRRLGPPVVADGTVYLASPRVDTDAVQGEEPPPAVFAVDAETGEIRWERDVVWRERGQASIALAPAVAHGDVYVAQRTFDEDAEDGLFALDAATGETRWVHRGVEPAPPHVGSGVVLQPAAETVLALDPADGSTCREYHVQGLLDRLLGGRRLDTRPAVVGRSAYVVSFDDPGDASGRWRYWLHRIDLETGEVRWTSDRFAAEEYVPNAVVADAERVYLPDGRRIHAFSFDGERAWSRSLAGTDEVRRLLVAGLAADGTHVFAQAAGMPPHQGLYALDAATGDVRWHRVDSSSVPVLGGRFVYQQRATQVAEDEYDRRLVAIDAETGEMHATRPVEWAMRRSPVFAGGRAFLVTADFGEDPNRGRPTVRLRAFS